LGCMKRKKAFNPYGTFTVIMMSALIISHTAAVIVTAVPESVTREAPYCHGDQIINGQYRNQGFETRKWFCRRLLGGEKREMPGDPASPVWPMLGDTPV
jgi:hypothetical protein